MTYSIPGDIRTKIVTSTSYGGIDSPFTKNRAILDMMKGWEIMKAVTVGTEYLRANSEAFFKIDERNSSVIMLLVIRFVLQLEGCLHVFLCIY